MTTLQKLFEEIQQIFPNVGGIQIVTDINRIYLDFCHETRIIKTSSNLTIDYDVVTYSLPTACDILEDVKFYDSSGNILTGRDALTWYVDSLRQIRFSSSSNRQITAIPASIATITLTYTQFPTELSAMSDETEIPTKQFDEAISVGVIAKYLKRFPTISRVDQSGNVSPVVDLQRAREYERDYAKLIGLGKKYRNEGSAVPTLNQTYYRYN